MDTTRCPGREHLAKYSLGDLSELETQQIEDHLAACASCEKLLGTLDRTADMVVVGLRRSRMDDPYASEPEYLRAVEQLNAVIAISTGAKDCPDESTLELGVPLRLDEYELLGKLGEGGMGVVYKARHTNLGRLVALKVLPTRSLTDERAISRFQREMLAIGRLSHPNIVQAYDARRIAGRQILVMEYVDGIDLDEVVRRHGPLPICDGCELVRQAAKGLQYAYEHGLVHRDIKPSNLMLTRRGQVKVLDLGLALLRTRSSGDLETTQIGHAVGTADYMAPEQIGDSHNVDIRADLYSLGCTLFKLITGRVPFDGVGKNAAERILAHLRSPVPSIRQLRAEVSEALARVVERLLAKSPSDRFSTPRELADALRPFSVGCNLAHVLVPLDVAQAPPQSEHSLVSTEESLIGKFGTKPDSVVPRRRYEAVGNLTIGRLGCGVVLCVTALLLLAVTGFFWTVKSLFHGPVAANEDPALLKSTEPENQAPPSAALQPEAQQAPQLPLALKARREPPTPFSGRDNRAPEVMPHEVSLPGAKETIPGTKPGSPASDLVNSVRPQLPGSGIVEPSESHSMPAMEENATHGPLSPGILSPLATSRLASGITLPSGRVFRLSAFATDNAAIERLIGSAINEDDPLEYEATAARRRKGVFSTSRLATQMLAVKSVGQFTLGYIDHSAGRLDGIGVTLYDERHLNHVAKYANNRRTGVLKKWDQNGQRAYWCQYDAGKRNGFCCLFHRGEPKAIGEWETNRLEWLHLLSGDQVQESIEGSGPIAGEGWGATVLARIEAIEDELQEIDRLLIGKAVNVARKSAEAEKQRLASKLGPAKRDAITSERRERASALNAVKKAIGDI